MNQKEKKGRDIVMYYTATDGGRWIPFPMICYAEDLITKIQQDSNNAVIQYGIISLHAFVTFSGRRWDRVLGWDNKKVDVLKIDLKIGSNGEAGTPNMIQCRVCLQWYPSDAWKDHKCAEIPNKNATPPEHPYNPKDKIDDPVNHPKHYTSHPSGIECIEITRHMNFNLGNVVKYLWRSGIKEAEVETQDLEKALWYLKDEIKLRGGKVE